MSDEMPEQCEHFFKVPVRGRKAGGKSILVRLEVHLRTEAAQCGFQLLQGERISTGEREIIRDNPEGTVRIGSAVPGDSKLEDVIDLVLDAVEDRFSAHRCLRDILVEVHDPRDIFDRDTLQAVRIGGGSERVLRGHRLVTRLADLVLRIAACLLVALEVIVAEILVHHPDDILPGHVIVGSDPGKLFLPGNPPGKRRGEVLAAVADGFISTHLILLEVALELLQDSIRELSPLDLLYLVQAHLHSLLLASERNVRNIPEKHEARVVEGSVHGSRHHHLVGVGKGIQQAAAALIGEQAETHGKRNVIRIGLLRSRECPSAELDQRDRHLDVHGLLPLDRLDLEGTCRSRALVGELSECLLQERPRLLGSDITAKDHSHVPRHIVFVEELRHLGQLRVLEVLGGSDDRA